ncbi:MAG: DNA topoisomerase (ATP-hydrolyzing) [Eubacteriales bacterium]|nr:DNA topoisomerase 4 subunit A [Christensenellaceae bacterium]MDY2751954.1 DNA topoisomerase (ATP-hydrolyzing) [Eubacteriales bacterium]
MAKKQIEIENKSQLYEMSVEEVMHTSMLPYSEYVILDRAIPRVEDGLKPVQRRILYAMYELGNTPDKPHKKSARIVGECLGKFHPHGDTSVYDAMVRMAQPFNMREVLIDGHGNFGSIDGDGAAAMRYTEARLNPLAMEILKDLEKDTVPWQWNFDDTMKEPVLLPCRFPNLLVNGANGIAVGFSTNIPTHNLGEIIDGAVAIIDNPRIKLDEIMKIIPGPDFSTGGIIIAGEELVQAYATGKGKVGVRARIHIEDGEYEKKNIVITELPYQVEKADLLQKILQLREAKKEILGGISDIVDESDRNGMRAVIKVRKDADAQKIVNYLLAHTKLETNFNINMVAIADGKPKLLGLIEMLTYYVNFQRDVLIKRCTFDLKQAKIRAEIVEGLLIAIKNIDEIIKIIKSSKTAAVASERMRQRFGLTERQAQAILEMKLRRLTGLEEDALKAELAELKKTIEELSAILNSKKLQNKKIKEDLLDVKKRFKTPRRSEIIGEKEAKKDVPFKSDETAYKEGVIVLSAKGTLKFVPVRSFQQAQRRASDADLNTVVSRALYANNKLKLTVFSNFGNIFKIEIDDLPEKRWRDKGASLGELSKDALREEYAVSVEISENFPIGEALFFTKQGMVKRTSYDELNVSKSAYKAINLSDGDEVIAVTTLTENTNVFTATRKGMCLLYETSEIPAQGRNAGGVKSIQLDDGDEVIFAGLINDEGEIVVVSDAGFAKRVFAFTFDLSKRYRKGVKLIDLPAGASVALVNYVREPYDVAIIDDEGNVFGFSTEDVKLDGRTTRGKQLRKFNGKITAYKHVVDYFRPLNI